MTEEQFKQLWEGGQRVKVSFDTSMPTANFQKFPEDVTAEHKNGEFFGVHFAFEDLDEFYADWTLCMFPLDVIGDVQRRKDSHGENVYLVKMLPDAKFPVLEVENGNEYRAETFMCIIKKVQL